MNYFKFDDIISTEYGIVISGQKAWDSPKRKVIEVEVEGKYGTLTIDRKTYEDVTVNYFCSIPKNFQLKSEMFKNKLMSKVGYFELFDTYNPNIKRRAKFSSGLEFEIVGSFNKSATFELPFICDARKFSIEGEREIIASGNTLILDNSTAYESKPIITVIGTGTIKILVNNYIFEVRDLVETKPVIIDCENMITTDGTIYKVTKGEYPVLVPGTNGIEVIEGTVTDLKVQPMYFTI